MSCHSEGSEESHLHTEILRCPQNDNADCKCLSGRDATKVSGWRNALRSAGVAFGRLAWGQMGLWMSADVGTPVKKRVSCACRCVTCRFAGFLTRKSLLCPRQGCCPIFSLYLAAACACREPNSCPAEHGRVCGVLEWARYAGGSGLAAAQAQAQVQGLLALLVWRAAALRELARRW